MGGQDKVVNIAVIKGPAIWDYIVKASVIVNIILVLYRELHSRFLT